MNFTRARLVSLTCLLLLPTLLVTQSSAAENWPQFRGPQASGVSTGTAPTKWNAVSGENILWQTPLPGLGHASPIVWGDKIYIATAVRPGAKSELKIGLYGSGDSYSEKEKHQWRLLCLDKATGKVLWDKLELEAVPRVERHTMATHCNSTPATDGKRVVAMFGSEGVFCYDMNGGKIWSKDLGKLRAAPMDAPELQWGFASSPVLYDDKVVVQVDTATEQFLTVFDATDGRELWRRPRKDSGTWCTPLVAKASGRTQVIANGWKEIGGYDFMSGEPFWWLSEGGDVPVASPIAAGDSVILTSGHGKVRPMRRVLLNATGDIKPSDISLTNRAVVWVHPRKGNYLQTPIVVGDKVWGCSNDGIVTCFDFVSGTINYEERIGGGGQGFTSSPVSAGGNLYFTGEQGDVFVIPVSEKFSVVATNKLGGICLATPAISDGTMFYRTTENLIAVGGRK
ncbi:MAG: PQQ-binding-like beta-propeller repeat protein [Verrucomicrobiota bacterium]